MAEYLEICDEDCVLTGEKKLRDEIHRDGDWHRVVHIWIVNGRGEILVQKRSAVKDTFPDHWSVSCAGHIDLGEDSMTAVLRELKEELGVRVAVKDVDFLGRQNVMLREPGVIDNEIAELYFVKIDSGDFRLQVEEVSEVKWVGLSELKIMIDSKAVMFVPYGDVYWRFIFGKLGLVV